MLDLGRGGVGGGFAAAYPSPPRSIKIICLSFRAKSRLLSGCSEEPFWHLINLSVSSDIFLKKLHNSLILLLVTLNYNHKKSATFSSSAFSP
jgi:hypothetical protein